MRKVNAMPKLRYLANVATLRLDSERCVGCGMCIEVCPHAVFVLQDQKICIQDQDACMECGACANNCPANALHVKAGVGCATAVINTALGRTGDCCCVIEEKE